DDRRRHVHRGPGHGRGRGVRPRRARRAARSGREGLRRPHPPAGRGARAVTRIVLASGNAKKLDELRRILEPLVPGIEVLGLQDVEPYDEPAETEPTFEGNALIKAREAARVTGLPALADDSGICVDALNAMPGVLSARWSGVPKDEGG